MSLQHDAWALVCRMFAGGTPIMRTALSHHEIRAMAVLKKMVKNTAIDQSYMLCPYCQQQRGEITAGEHGDRMCRCPECGPVTVHAEDFEALRLDEEGFRQKLRMAMEIDSRDGITDLGGGIWRLGEARNAPVLLVRNMMTLLRTPHVLDRVRTANGNLKIITPRLRDAVEVPFIHGVEWLGLEERFMLYGGRIAYLASPDQYSAISITDPTLPVFGPFSADFRWVTLPDWPHGLIHCTEGQAAIFEALWSYKGEPMTAEWVMRRANLSSDKPIDLFKVKSRDKGKPEAEGPLFAYNSLVDTQQRQGLYAMPCASGQKRSPLLCHG